VASRVLILGAGFGGLELATLLSERFGEDAGVTLIDRSDAFTFGYAKLDVMFGRTTREAVRLPYAEVVKPGVRLVREEITAIDAQARRVTTDAGAHEADVLVIALGADYDVAATPGLAEAGHEFYSVDGAAALRDVLPAFTGGHVVIGVCGAPFKCPPAPSECALLVHDLLVERGVRERSQITLMMPLPSPVPPSPTASAVILEEFAARGITFQGDRRITGLDAGARTVLLRDGDPVPFDLFLGVPRHRAPDVVIASGITEDGYVPVDVGTLETPVPGVYAIGDVATAGVPKAGVFAEGAAKVVAARLIAERTGGPMPPPNDGRGSCWIEFGTGRVARVDIDFLSGPERTGTISGPSAELAAEKEQFGSSRMARWFGRTAG
jgi:sulfide:quinone oxidoreductase